MALWRAAWGQRPTIGPDVAMMEGGAVNPEPRGEVSREAERGAIMPLENVVEDEWVDRSSGVETWTEVEGSVCVDPPLSQRGSVVAGQSA